LSASLERRLTGSHPMPASGRPLSKPRTCIRGDTRQGPPSAARGRHCHRNLARRGNLMATDEISSERSSSEPFRGFAISDDRAPALNRRYNMRRCLASSHTKRGASKLAAARDF
jgi:hypothetical protein